ncbi:PfkB family carbohydrate kinase [Actinobaculum suis]|uniref:PfkB family carbohydrate kinase n=1 Tax=Actinobaculum suis TaxID=1657 RepID=UPI00069D52BC|nr:PfkB family carbohydrate kinase [Actinobaculum suis]
MYDVVPPAAATTDHSSGATPTANDHADQGSRDVHKIAGRFINTGQAIVDVVMRVDRVPEPGGDVFASKHTLLAGGDFNVMAAGARAGASVVYAGSYGQGVYADIVLAALREENIEVLAAPVPDMDTGFCVALVDNQAERTFISTVGAEGVIGPGQYALAAPGPQDVVYISGYSLVHEANRAELQRWLAAGISARVLFDPAPVVAEVPEPALAAVLARADVVTANAREAQILLTRLGAAPAGAETAAARAALAEQTDPAGAFRPHPVGVETDPLATETDPAGAEEKPTEAVLLGRARQLSAATGAAVVLRAGGAGVALALPGKPDVATSHLADARGAAEATCTAEVAGAADATDAADVAGAVKTIGTAKVPTVPASSFRGGGSSFRRSRSPFCGSSSPEQIRAIFVPPLRVTAVDTNGAGDAHAGVLGAGLCRGESLGLACARAGVAAGIAVTREGPATSPRLAELDAAYAQWRTEIGPERANALETFG